jgi:serine/threonine protein kinase
MDVLSSGAMRDPARRAQFSREGQVSCGADPVRVVPRTTFLANGRLIALYDVPAGHTLEAIGAPLDIDAAIHVCLDVSLGLASIHRQGFVHGALRPAAIAAHMAADGPHALLLDVGHCLETGAARLADVNSHISMAGGFFPPSVLGGAPLDEDTDIYAFGALCFTLLTGARWRATTIASLPDSSLPDETPLQLAALVMQCLSPVPARRPHSMISIAAALHNLSLDKGPVLVATRWEAPPQAVAPRRRQARQRAEVGFGAYAGWFIDDDVTKLGPEQLASLIGYQPEPGARSVSSTALLGPWVLGAAALLLSPAAALLVYLGLTNAGLL